MTTYITKSTNQTALALSNFHSTFEQCLTAVSNIKHKRDLRIKDDPMSSQHVLVQSYQSGLLKGDLRIEKRAVVQANRDRLALYHLVAVVLDHFKTA
ncbi:hypothetical protein [Acinetobacter bereziniae]|uniref:hypothetical protein n=1 Tax=Acinetobacter bereziniae TaxID=106648 RepID=UPI003570D630